MITMTVELKVVIINIKKYISY